VILKFTLSDEGKSENLCFILHVHVLTPLVSLVGEMIEGTTLVTCDCVNGAWHIVSSQIHIILPRVHAKSSKLRLSKVPSGTKGSL
jgi:hypothetical protein